MADLPITPSTSKDIVHNSNNVKKILINTARISKNQRNLTFCEKTDDSQKYNCDSKLDESSGSLLIKSESSITSTKYTQSKNKNALCLINELVRFNRCEREYKLVDENGPPHCKTFKVQLTLRKFSHTRQHENHKTKEEKGKDDEEISKNEKNGNSENEEKNGNPDNNDKEAAANDEGNGYHEKDDKEIVDDEKNGNPENDDNEVATDNERNGHPEKHDEKNGNPENEDEQVAANFEDNGYLKNEDEEVAVNDEKNGDPEKDDEVANVEKNGDPENELPSINVGDDITDKKSSTEELLIEEVYVGEGHSIKKAQHVVATLALEKTKLRKKKSLQRNNNSCSETKNGQGNQNGKVERSEAKINNKSCSNQFDSKNRCLTSSVLLNSWAMKRNISVKYDEFHDTVGNGGDVAENENVENILVEDIKEIIQEEEEEVVRPGPELTENFKPQNEKCPKKVKKARRGVTSSKVVNLSDLPDVRIRLLKVQEESEMKSEGDVDLNNVLADLTVTKQSFIESLDNYENGQKKFKRGVIRQMAAKLMLQVIEENEELKTMSVLRTSVTQSSRKKIEDGNKAAAVVMKSETSRGLLPKRDKKIRNNEKEKENLNSEIEKDDKNLNNKPTNEILKFPSIHEIEEKGKSLISFVYECASKQMLSVQFRVVHESGPPHQKLYLTQCIVGNFVAQGQGESKRDSKREACRLMIQYMSTLPTRASEITRERDNRNSKGNKNLKKIFKESNFSGVDKRESAEIPTTEDENDVQGPRPNITSELSSEEKDGHIEAEEKEVREENILLMRKIKNRNKGRSLVNSNIETNSVGLNAISRLTQMQQCKGGRAPTFEFLGEKDGKEISRLNKTEDASKSGMEMSSWRNNSPLSTKPINLLRREDPPSPHLFNLFSSQKNNSSPLLHHPNSANGNHFSPHSNRELTNAPGGTLSAKLFFTNNNRNNNNQNSFENFVGASQFLNGRPPPREVNNGFVNDAIKNDVGARSNCNLLIESMRGMSLTEFGTSSNCRSEVGNNNSFFHPSSFFQCSTRTTQQYSLFNNTPNNNCGSSPRNGIRVSGVSANNRFPRRHRRLKSKVFTMKATIGDLSAEASGETKKMAKLKAAEQLLALMKSRNDQGVGSIASGDIATSLSEDVNG